MTSYAMILQLCLLVASSCVTAHARLLLQGPQQGASHFDLLLAVKPEPHLAYGGRHITIASITASSRSAIESAVKHCNKHLEDHTTKAVGWSMKGPPANCLGHMDAGSNVCKDSHRWDLTKDGYSYTPTISIASDTLNAYADCVAKASSGGVTITIKGPKSGTSWHSALYGASKAEGQAEFDRFVNNHAKWTPFINQRNFNAFCPATLSPRGQPGPIGNHCWLGTAVA